MTTTGETVREACARAESLTGLRRFDEALAVLAEGLASSPDDPDLHVARAHNLRMLERPGEALAAADAAVAAAPQRPEGYVARAWALLDLGGGAGEAVRSARSALAADPDHRPAQQALATASLAVGDVDSAAGAAAALLLTRPDAADGLFLLGSVHLTRGEWEEAERCLAAVLAVAPDSIPAMTNLAVALLHSGRAEEAATWMARVASGDPGLPTVATRVAGSLLAAVEQRLDASATPRTVVQTLVDAASATEQGPPFVRSLVRHLLGSRLLRPQEDGDLRENVLRALALLEEAADTDPTAPVGEPTGTGLVRELHTLSWLGGERYRARSVQNWRHDAAEATLVSVPVLGDRAGRVARALTLLEEAPAGEPLLDARAHVTAGRAWAMRPDGERDANLRASAAHFEDALATYRRMGVLGPATSVETSLMATYLSIPPDRDRQPLDRALAVLAASAARPTRHARPQQHAVAVASLAEGHLARLRCYGDAGDHAAAVEHAERAAQLMGSAGHATAAAHFLQLAARAHLARAAEAPASARDALSVLERAEKLTSRGGATVRWASVRADLAHAHRLLGGRRDLDTAVRLAGEGLETLVRADDPKDWGMAARSLALALAARSAGRGWGRSGPVTDASEARALLTSVLEELVPRLTTAENAELALDVSTVVGGVLSGGKAGHQAGDRALLDDAGRRLTLARADAAANAWTRLLRLVDAETARLERLRVTRFAGA